MTIPAFYAELQLSSGLLGGITHVNKFGRNTDIDLTPDEDVWDGGGVWVAPTQARIHQIASTDAADDGAPVGAGARTIKVFGLTDWDTAEVSEVVTMNGLSNVATTNAYVIIHRLKVLTKGATNVNVGVITATADTDGTVTAQINIGQGQTQMAIYGIPSVQTTYMTKYYCSNNRAQTAAFNATVMYNPEPDAELTNFLVKHTLGGNSAGTTAVEHEFWPYNKFAGPGILKVNVGVSAVNSDISAGFDLILVDN